MFLDDLFKKLQSVEKNYMKKKEEDIKNKYDLKAVSSLCSYLAIYDDKKNPHTITFPVVTGSLLEVEHGSYREFSFDLKKMYHSVLVTAFIASYILGIRYSNQSGQYIIFPDIVEKIKSLFKAKPLCIH